VRLVADTGPLIGLAKIDRLHILKNLTSSVEIPPAVSRELLGKTGYETELIDNALHDFIRVSDVGPLEQNVRDILVDLDEGERQAIGLASKLSEDVILLIDDRAGRSAAEKLHIPTTGLIGILLLAKEKGIVTEVGALLDDLRKNGYWISDEIVEIARHLAGEKPPRP